MTRKGSYQDTKTLQVWPGGASYTYRGDLWGASSRRSLRRRSFLCSACSVKTDEYPHCGHSAAFITETATWRKGTAEEWRRIRVEERARRLQQEEIYHADSALVDDLIRTSADGQQELGGFTYEDMRNLYADPSDWDAERCREYAEENGVELDTPDACAEHQKWHSACPACEEMANDDSRGGWLTEARDACREYAQDHPAEVYEWYRVSRYLCELLHAVGEVTIDNDYGYWWGRQTTGQNNLMDGVLQRCAVQADEQLRPGKGAGA